MKYLLCLKIFNYSMDRIGLTQFSVPDECLSKKIINNRSKGREIIDESS